MLLALLDERHAIYHGSDSFIVARMRAALLQSVTHHSLSFRALPFVLEELESADDPKLTAVAASALRKFPEPSARFVQPLLDAISAIHSHDAPVSLGANSTTATREILRTLRWLVEFGAYSLAELESVARRRLLADDAEALLRGVVEGVQVTTAIDSDPILRTSEPIPQSLTHLLVQDHSGAETTVGELFSANVTLVFFFFTRCGNAMKCPLTVAQLARLQHRIESEGLNVSTAAFTYDPEYDTAERLLHYARSWGAIPSHRHRFLRVPKNFATIREFFELGVGYGPGGVNRHQLEAFVVDGSATLVAAIKRRRWTEEQLLAIAKEVG